MKHNAIKAVPAMVALDDLKLEQLAVKIAIFHGELEDHIYMTQLERFFILDMKNHVFLLTKPFYRLKQLSIKCYKRFDIFIYRMILFVLLMIVV